MKNEGLVRLSNKSLKIVWQWCEENRDDQLSKAYITACCLITDVTDDNGKSELLKANRKDSDYRYITEWSNVYEMAFKCRDTIGRIIFDNLKRTKAI